MDQKVTHTEGLGPEAKSFIARKQKMLIGGKWVEAASGQTFDTIDPASEEVIAKIPAGDKEDVDRAVKAARKAFESKEWRGMRPADRQNLLLKLADLIEDNTEELAQLESLDNGKLLFFSRIVDVAGTVEYFRYMAGWATKIEGRTFDVSQQGGEFAAMMVREPVGVVGQIIPWNFPLAMAAWKLGPALACGCTSILKPAEQTSLSALRLGELILEAGFPEGVVNIVTGLGETAGASLVAHPDVDKIAFTGSTSVGKMIGKSAMDTMKRVSLELGGKSPVIVTKDADLNAAIAGAASAIFFNSGQVCAAGSRLYVEKPIFDKVVEGVAEAAKSIKLGHGRDPNAQMGPLISDEQLSRVMGYIEKGREEGGEILAGGKRHGNKGYFVEPTVFANTKRDSIVVREEIFGPVVVANSFDSVDEIAATANASDYGLAASIWTKDISFAHKLARRIKAGTVWINTHNNVDPNMPFGGFKQSGIGRESGRDAIDLYTEKKSILIALG